MPQNLDPGQSLFISTEALAATLADPSLVIVDCRFDLKRPEWGRMDYAKGHIPGAFFADLNSDLSGVRTPSSGWHPLPDPEGFFSFLSLNGLSSDKKIVVYDTCGGAFAARLAWLLKGYGYPKVQILNGGFQHWLSSGCTSAVQCPVRPISSETPPPFNGRVVSTQDVLQHLGSGRWVLIDSRSPERFFGREEPIYPVAGHIPGAFNYFYGVNFSQQGLLKDHSTLRSQFEEIPYQNKDKIVFYCGSGVTSCLNLLLFDALFSHASFLYLGSWSEWIADPDRPIEK